MSEAIKEILEEMKKFKDANSEEFNTKIKELQDKLKTRDEEYDKKFKSLDEQRDKIINDAIEEFKKANVNTSATNTKVIDEKIYGKNFGEFVYKTRNNNMELKALSENVGADGGILVPEVWSQEILKVPLEQSIIRNNGAKVINMPSLTFKIPLLAYSNNTDTNQYGGVTAYWADEASDLSAFKTSPKFKYLELTANKLVGFTDIPEELNQDAYIALSPYIQSLFSEVILYKEDAAFINGNGIDKPLGILSAPCTVTVSRSTASQIHPIDLVGMIARFKGSLDNAFWGINQTSIPQLYTLKDNNGNFIFHPGMSGNISGKVPGTVYGIPVILSEKFPALGSEGDVGLYDLGQYLIGDREGLRIEDSKHYQFNLDKNSLKFVKRVEGKPWMNEPITPYKGSSTLSPFVILK